MKFRFLFFLSFFGIFPGFLSCSSGHKGDDSIEIEKDSVATDTVIVRDSTNAWMPKEAKIMPSGLGLVIHNPGDTARITLSSKAKVNYSEALTNGKVIKSTFKNGEPEIISPLNMVAGFTEGLQQIGVGGKATLYVPSDLAYGYGGHGAIGPKENLIYELELIEITE